MKIQPKRNWPAHQRDGTSEGGGSLSGPEGSRLRHAVLEKGLCRYKVHLQCLDPQLGKSRFYSHRLKPSFYAQQKWRRMIMQLLVMLETWDKAMQSGPSALGADQPLNEEPPRSCAGLTGAQPRA